MSIENIVDKPIDPIGYWIFQRDDILLERTGHFDNLTLHGATISDGKLHLANGQYARAQNYKGPEIRSKTLISFFTLNNLDVRTGSVLTLDKINSDVFDAIVYAEKENRKWMAGSSFFHRTKAPMNPGYQERSTGQEIMMAITYEEITGNQFSIKVYRNGDLIGSYNKGPVSVFQGYPL